MEPAKPRLSVLGLLQLAAAYLEKKGVLSARREADALLGHVLEKDRLHLYLAFEDVPSETEVNLFRAAMKRRGEREPLQYILGEGRFLGLRLKLDARALIPRPETEAFAQRLRKLVEAGTEAADIGTGSGCIAISLAAHGVKMQASDISPSAIALAKENAQLNGLEERIRFTEGNLLESIQGPLDLIVSNPPYIVDATPLQAEVGGFEPALALFGGPDGMQLLRRLLETAPMKLKSGAWLALECGENQPAVLAEEAKAAGVWSEILIEEDPFGVARFLLTRRV